MSKKKIKKSDIIICISFHNNPVTPQSDSDVIHIGELKRVIDISRCSGCGCETYAFEDMPLTYYYHGNHFVAWSSFVPCKVKDIDEPINYQ